MLTKVPLSFKREHERSKQIFIVIKRLNFLEKTLKEKMETDVYSDQFNNLISKYETASSGIPNFDLDMFSKNFGLEDQFYAIQAIKNRGSGSANKSAMQILDTLHELDTKIAIDKSNNSAYVSEYKLFFSELTSNYDKLPKSQKNTLRDVYQDTVYSDFQGLMGKENNDLLEEIQLTIMQNNLFRFSQTFRRVIMS